jgi:hypothetical protein
MQKQSNHARNAFCANECIQDRNTYVADGGVGALGKGWRLVLLSTAFADNNE